jgi:hypothetical protein
MAFGAKPGLLKGRSNAQVIVMPLRYKSFRQYLKNQYPQLVLSGTMNT